MNKVGPMKIVISIVAVLLFLFFLNLFAPNIFSGAAHYISIPFWSISRNVENNLSKLTAIFGSKEKLFYENMDYRAQILEMRIKLKAKEVLLKEYEELSKAFGGNDKNLESVYAGVISRPPLSPYDTLIINVGRDKNILAGDEVFFGDMFLGEVAEVFGESSIIKLASGPGEKTNIVINGKIHATAEGMGNGNFMIKIPKNIEVKIGDSVAADKSGVPFIGEVSFAGEKSSDSFQEILFRTSANISEIRGVRIAR